MGITDKAFLVLEEHFKKYPNTKSVLELGSQNFYHNFGAVRYGVYADVYYRAKGVTRYECIDINGENGARVLNLTQPVPFFGAYDLVTDFGTQEHISTQMNVEHLYNCWTTKYNAASRHIISANPKTGNWPKHGAYYFRKEFYEVLARLTGMKIVRLEEHFVMGNDKDGWEVLCILEKTPASKWITMSQFCEAYKELRSS
jgi:hypothetical protein